MIHSPTVAASSLHTYVRASGVFDEVVARALSKCMFDLDLYVRVTVIRWAIKAPDDRFALFRRLVVDGVGCPEPRLRNTARNDVLRETARKRGARGILIIEQLRNGSDVRAVAAAIGEEDSFVFDLLDLRGPRPPDASARP